MNNNDDNLTLMLLAAGFITIGGIPLVLGAALPETQTWLLNLGILLPADQSQLVLPGTEVGLDFLRLIIAGGLLCAAVTLAAYSLKRRRNS